MMGGTHLTRISKPVYEVIYLPQVINTTTPSAAKKTTRNTVAFTESLFKMVEIFFITPVLKYVITGTDSNTFSKAMEQD
jgi:hypothetical protein